MLSNGISDLLKALRSSPNIFSTNAPSFALFESVNSCISLKKLV
jgi:hypothetical protein